MLPVTLALIEAARARITPHLSLPTLLEWAPGLGPDVYLKLENLNPTHSFKVRGALNAVLALDPAARARGLIAASSGNHAQALAYAARIVGVPATILVPAPTPQRKIDGVLRAGGQPVLFGATYDQAEAEARRRAHTDGLTFVSPYNDAHVIAGAGTIGLELVEQLPNVGRVVVCGGGGGLISGIATALRAVRPHCEVIAACARNAPAVYNALHGTAYPQHYPTLAEALSGEIEIDSITIPIVQQLVNHAVLLDEADLAAAIRWLLDEHGWLAEGGGAVGVAALRTGSISVDGVPTVVIISGGNIDATRLHALLQDTVRRF